MPDRISICNMALGRLGAVRIASLDEATTQADLCRDHYQQCVDEVLEDHPWNFAEHAARLAAATIEDARPDFGYCYVLPTGGQYPILAPRWLMDGQGKRSRCGYRISGAHLYTELAGAWLVYTYRAPEHRWSPLFVKCVMHLLAARLAGPLTETEAKVEIEQKLYEAALPVARNRNSQQDTPEVFDTSLLIEAHVG